MKDMLPLRLPPGVDLRKALDAEVTARGCQAAFVVAGIGSLAEVRLRLAGADKVLELQGEYEILTLSGTLGAGGSHLHMSISDASGQVLGGHVAPGCIVRTTVEVLLALLPEWDFSRQPDQATGYAELVITRTATAPSSPPTHPADRS